MECLDKLNIREPKTGSRILVPCGKCNICLQNKRREWSIRIGHEMQYAKSAFFLTLTYDDDHVVYGDGALTLVPMDTVQFIKALRYRQNQVLLMKDLYHYEPRVSKKGKSVLKRVYDWPQMKYYLIGEYGEQTLRPHYHLICFNLRKEVADNIGQVWTKGLYHVGTVTQNSIDYVTGYVMKKGNWPKGTQRPFSRMSKKMGDQFLKANAAEIKKKSKHTAWTPKASKGHCRGTTKREYTTESKKI